VRSARRGVRKRRLEDQTGGTVTRRSQEGEEGVRCSTEGGSRFGTMVKGKLLGGESKEAQGSLEY